MTYSSLVLFDIDGTLLRRAGEHHQEALVYGVRRVTGLDVTTDGIAMQGMLDPVIMAQMIRNAGGTRRLATEAMPQIVRSAERYYLRTCPALHGKHCPAVEPTLERLLQRGALLGLVTGNLTKIAWRKLERAGLRDYFQYGAFGEMAGTRAGLAKIAIIEARRQGWIDKQAPVSLIGDAPSDVQAARSNQITSIAVHTGVTTAEELKAGGPDYLLRDLRHLRLYMIGLGRAR